MSYKTLWVSSWVCERDADCSRQVWLVLGEHLPTLTTSQHFLSTSAHTPPSFQHRLPHCHNVEEPIFPKACIWEHKEHWRDYLSVSKTHLWTTISLWILVQPGVNWSLRAHSRSTKFVLRGREQPFIHSYVQGGLDKGKSMGDELRFGQFVGTSISILAEKGMAFL